RLRDPELGCEAIGFGLESLHRDRRPLRFRRLWWTLAAGPARTGRLVGLRLDPPVEELGAYDIVTVAEDDRRRLHHFALRPFDRVARAIDRRADVVDDDAHRLDRRIVAKQHASVDARTTTRVTDST